MLKITHIAHACFVLDNGRERMIIDPYDNSIGYEPIKETVNYCLMTHDHYDHNHTENIELSEGTGSFSFRAIKSFHDKEEGKLRGENIIYVIKTDNLTICHLGDLGHLLTEEQIKQIGKIDVLLIPVGGTYTIDYKEAIEVVKQLNPTIVIPMHYKTDNTHLGLDRVDNFIADIKRDYILIEKDVNFIEFQKSEDKKCYVI